MEGWKTIILEVHGKVLWGESHEKPIYRGDCGKRGIWTICRFKGGLGSFCPRKNVPTRFKHCEEAVSLTSNWDCVFFLYISKHEDDKFYQEIQNL